MKFTFIFGTRPETIKLAPLILEARRHGHDAKIVLTGQHREMAQQMLGLFGLKADLDLDVMRPGQSLTGLSARVLEALDEKLASLPPPDWVLVQGDTTSAFVAGYWAFLRGIRVAHVEAGLRTYDLQAPFPEEANRQLLARIADLQFAPTEQAARSLKREGVSPGRIKKVGNSGIDALLWMRKQIDWSKDVPEEIRQFANAASGPKILVTAHRRESFGKDFENLCEGIRLVSQKYPDARIIYPVHPNPNVRAPVEKHLKSLPNVKLVSPLGYVPFVATMDWADVLLTDSGGVQEEAPSLRKPVLVMRKTTERPEGVKKGYSRLVGTDPKKILAGVARAVKKGCEGRGGNPYGDGKAADRIVRELERQSRG